ncbi:hypothetical protein AHAS_Ahas09G0118900 [Arachis hypogaea]
MTLDDFLGEQGVHLEREEEHIEVPTTEDARSRPSPNDGENVHIPMRKIILVNIKMTILMWKETKL